MNSLGSWKNSLVGGFEKWSDRMNVVFSWLKRGRWYIPMEYYSAIKGSLTVYNYGQDCEGIMFSNVKSERQVHIASLVCGN